MIEAVEKIRIEIENAFKEQDFHRLHRQS